ncbi:MULTISPECIES: hypothetical protein [Lactobacillus]|uniref:DUF4054 domain-containing protein n=1 Tax=Lactobacillus xujianguonis TaxID=2495899 RepID=A0A437SST7_9LACO|nr:MULTISPECIES: hypothetical protein [Lactobacillus]RVU70016.1 hypothetical protein EJK17_09785 [Lactobacillus xujianguonis]RVU73453.1 hypothetical protein EJK20_08195 [Lactobacillus xujianguonis]
MVTDIDEVTPALVRTIGGDTFDKKTSDETIAALIDQANLIALTDSMPETATINNKVLPIEKMATLYMTLHLASVIGKSGRGITAEKVDVLERHYADTTSKGWLNSSRWGLLYLWLYRRFGDGQTPRMAVIPH